MNDNLSEPLAWDEQRQYNRGKVLDARQLEDLERYGRYLDVDGDGIPYRTVPGTHPTKGAFFTRGSSRDPYAIYTEDGQVYAENMERLSHKWEHAKHHVPKPVSYPAEKKATDGVIFFGTSDESTREAMTYLAESGVHLDGLRLKAFPFSEEVERFINEHERVFVVEFICSRHCCSNAGTRVDVVPGVHANADRSSATRSRSFQYLDERG